jgi:very-short-patch-repair endonuclease
MSDLARRLRKESTDAERRLWRELRDRRLSGYKFRRQHPIGPYVVDFVCLEHNLVIEVDGGHHLLQEHADRKRSEHLASLGFRMIRFWNDEVLAQTPAVLDTVLRELTTPHPHPSPSNSPSPNPSPSRERG